MTLSDLIKQLQKLEAIHGPTVEVLLSVDDSYYGNVDHAMHDPVFENGRVLLTDVCNFHPDPDAHCPAKELYDSADS